MPLYLQLYVLLIFISRWTQSMSGRSTGDCSSNTRR